MIRFLKVILPLYVLILVLIPCSDGEHIHPETESHIQNLTQDNQHSQDCEEDECSPFCVCSCCRISVILNIPNNIFSKKDFTPSKGYIAYFQDAIFLEFRKPLFQPPIC